MEHFTLFDLDSFDTNIKNPFLDAHKINILQCNNLIRVCIKCDFYVINLDAKYWTTLVDVEINLVVLSKLNKLGF